MIIPRDNLYFHIPVRRLLEEIEQALNLGVNYEIYIASAFIDNHKASEIELINRGFRQKNLLKRVHGPFMDICPGSSDKKVRALSQQRMLAGIELCSRLECTDIILHSHYDPVYHKRHFDEWLDLSVRVWDNVDKQAKKAGITIYIENSEDDTPEAVVAILQRYPSFKACFDLAHYTVFGAAGWEECLNGYPYGAVGEVHLSDNDGKEDLHLVLGKGCVDIKGFLEEMDRRGEKPVITVEPHSGEDMLLDMKYMERFVS